MIFFFNDTATTEIYTLSLHDALPICAAVSASALRGVVAVPLAAMRSASRATDQRGLVVLVGARCPGRDRCTQRADRKSTRLNSSHANISYAVFCLKKKIQDDLPIRHT